MSGRRVVNYTVYDEGRDLGKVFVITEMVPSRAEDWGFRAILSLMAGNVDLPDGFERLGMAGMAEIGLKGLTKLKWEEAKPLLDEMWSCIQIMPDPKKSQIVRNLIEEDIEEVMTRVKLRAEVWKLHTGFLKAAVLSTSEDSPVAARRKNMRSMPT